MDYAAGVWGHNNNEKLDQIDTRAMRCYLGVNKYTAKCGIEGDVGWLTPKIRRSVEMLRLWNRIVSMPDTRLPKAVYNYLHQHNLQWIKEVKEIFMIINCTDIFQENIPIINFKEFKEYAVCQLISLNRAQWLRNVANKPKLHLYATYKSQNSTESYCKVNLTRSQRSYIAKLRLGVLPINVEIGRYSGIPRNERFCLMCNNNEVEDEIHVMLKCPSYDDLRKPLIEHAQCLCSSFNTLSNNAKIGVLASHINIVRKTANYIHSLLRLRERYLRVET